MKKQIGTISWAWGKWLPNSILTLVVGEPGTGKSLLTLVGIVKPFLTGCPWPDGTPYAGEQGKVLWIETEGGESLNIERAEKFELPLERIVSISLDEDTSGINIDNPTQWRQIKQAALRDDVKIIVVDSLSGGHTQDENSISMLHVVKPLAVLARTTGKPVIATHHLNKMYVAPGEAPNLRNVRGHTSIVQTARIIWAIDVPNKLNFGIKRLTVIKNNLGLSPEPITYTVTESGVELTNVPQPARRRTKQDQATELLKRELADGPVPSVRIEENLREKGLLDAAKKMKASLGIVSEPIDGVWHWMIVQEDGVQSEPTL